MKKLLIIDDDEALRGLYRRRLSNQYEIVETGEPEQSLALALEHKPDAILLDLKMPNFDGFELCRNFRSLARTSNLPIFVVTGQSGSYRKECEAIGAAGYFEKPIDFAKLKRALATSLDVADSKPREVTPLRMRVSLKLQGIDRGGEQFTELVATEYVSPDGFQFRSLRDLAPASVLDVVLTGSMERHVGQAKIVEQSPAGLELQAYCAVFDSSADWILQRG